MPAITAHLANIVPDIRHGRDESWVVFVLNTVIELVEHLAKLLQDRPGINARLAAG